MTIQKISTLAGAALLAGGLLAGAVAQAQPAPYRGDHRPPPARLDDRRPSPPPAANPHRPPPPPAAYPRRPPPPAQRPAMVAPPPMAVGRPLPYDYRGYNYRVDNWSNYHLPRPRRNQYWVQYGSQFLLVNTGGIVLQIFMP